MESTKILNGYIGFYNCKRVELYATDTSAAIKAAISFFRPPKSKQHMVHVYLAELNGQPVIHTPDF